ncbi:MAG: thioesterase family protein [Acidimicrobiales bacterium]
MDARTFLGLEPRSGDGLEPRSSDRTRWRLTVTSSIATPSRFLFGGCGLAAGIESMEIASGRPCVWASAQYLSYAPVGSVVDLDVTLAVTGHQMTQARCVGRVHDQEIFTVNATLGRRSMDHTGMWAQAPEVRGPELSLPRDRGVEFAETIMARVDTRLAEGRQYRELDGTPGSGRSALWCRMPDLLEPSAASLAVLGDMVPSGVAQALGLPAGGNSLDNTLRVVKLVPTEWVLVDLRIHAIEHGIGHGLAHLWAEDGSLLATASQSVIVRLWDGRPPGERRRRVPTVPPVG